MAEAGFEPLAKEQLIAPHLMWSEVSSVLHELKWRKEISNELVVVASERLAAADVSPRHPKGLTAEAWRIADRLGWAKTYDAEYLALARLPRSRLLTTGAKLKSAAATMLNVVGPTDL